MTTWIVPASDTAEALKELERGPGAVDTVFEYPDELQRDDRIVYFAAGRMRRYVGTCVVDSDWRMGTTGAWAGYAYAYVTGERRIRREVSAEDVQQLFGVTPRRHAVKVPPDIENALWTYLRTGREPETFALENILTETRALRRTRDRRLRDLALDLSKGVCEACGVNYGALLNGKGRRVLVVHHRHQLGAGDAPVITDIDDLAVLCANCHALVHADPRAAMSVDELRKLMKRARARPGG